MPENPHDNEDLEPKDEKLPAAEKKRPAGSAWREDQKTRGYYYDDAHGYEIFNPDEDEEEED